MLNLVANGPSGYTINNSLRFRSSASAYLNRSVSSTSNRTTYTFSAWIKRGGLTNFTGTNQYLFHADNYNTGGTSNDTEIFFDTNDKININFAGTSTNYNLTTTQVFRDPSAWYHIVVAIDTTQATSSNRYKLYVNGSQVIAFDTANYPPQNTASLMNLSGSAPSIGAFNLNGTRQRFFDGYMAEVNFIDGQALTPSSFGSTNATTGVWQPAKYTGTYGTNGFYLKFSNIALTSGSNTGLGQDFSGNGNYWNTNNISVTAGTTYDAMTDVPTLTSSTTANYCTLNPLLNYASSPGTLSAANLQYANSSASNGSSALGTLAVSSGKWYFEMTVTSGISAGTSVGIAGTDFNPSSNADSYYSRIASGYGYQSNGQKTNNNSFTSYGASWTNNDVIGVALDLDGGTLTFYKNNTSQGTAYTGISGTFVPAVYSYGTSVANFVLNFGQRPFTYTPPTGFVALNTYNLPTPTILQGNKYMDATTYTGNGSTQSITNTAGFKPDLVWVKSRSAATDHKLTDSVRGVTKALISDTTGAETTDTNGLTAFNSNGWSLGTDTNYNNNTATYVGWQWQAGQGSSSSNTNGSITSTVSVNATAGFSVVTWASASGTNTVGHGLGVAPKMIIAKNRSIVSNWPIYHTSIGGANILLLDTTNASAANTTWFNGTAPTSTVFSTSTGFGNGNYCVAYCFAEIAGFSKFGSYTGNGSADGPFVYCGFRPKFVLIKRSDGSTEQWDINDTSRDPYNAAQYYLAPNSSIAEVSVNPTMDILSNGFKIRYNGGPWNSSGGTYIYMAFAENPTKFSLAR